MTDRAHAKPAQPATPVNFDVPPGAVDSHTHVFPDPQKFPFWSGRAYTPPVATADDLLALQKALHMDHVVIVTPTASGLLPGALDHLGLIVKKADDVDKWAAFLEGQGVKLDAKPKTHRDGARSCYFRDPDGNRVQVIHHPPISGKV